MSFFEWLHTQRWTPYRAAALGAVLVLLRGWRRWRRRRRPAQLHPRLQKYAGLSAAELKAEREAAMKIIATSSTGELAGYELIQQIEAVFVEGHRSPQDALTALKAAAGRLSANAIVNLSHERTTAGRCTAQGDAVVVRPKLASAAKDARDPDHPSMSKPESGDPTEPHGSDSGTH
jgi:uncharacterized protein YbjQ (UPF0145 family)